MSSRGDPSLIAAHDGHLCLVLATPCRWEDYPRHLEHWILRLGATCIEQVDSVDERLARVVLDGREFWITYDDTQASVQLEPCSGNEDTYLRALCDRLASG